MAGYDGRGSKFNIVAVEGNDLALTVTAVDDAAAAVDLSAATITATVYNSAGATIDTMTDAVSGAGSNVITLSLTDAEVDALVDPKSWALVVDRGGDARTWLAGSFTVADPSRARSGTSGTALTATVDSDVNVTVTMPAVANVSTFAASLLDDATAAAARATLDVLPPQLPTLYVVGDSLLINDYSSETTMTAPATPTSFPASTRSVATWMNAYLGQRFKWVGTYSAGGETSTQILAAYDAEVLANDGDYVLLWLGHNDITSAVTSATVIANITAMIDANKADGRRSIVLTLGPSENYDTASEKEQLHEVNNWIRALPTTRADVVVVDAWKLMADPVTGYPRTGYSVDTVHPSQVAAHRVGLAIANTLDPVVPAVPNPLVTATDPINANGGAGMPSSGTGWTKVGAAEVALTFPVDDESGANMALLTYTANAGSEGFVQYQTNTSSGLWAPGDTLRASVDLEWNISAVVAGTAEFEPHLAALLRTSGGAFDMTAFAIGKSSGDNEGNTWFPLTGRVTLITPPFVMQSDHANIYLRAGALNVATGTVKVRDFSMWRLV